MWSGEASGAWTRRVVLIVAIAVVLGYGGMWLLGRWVAAARDQVETASCTSNVHILTRAVRIYADDYEGRFPPCVQWGDGTAPYVDSARRYSCPTVRARGMSFGYAMNTALSGAGRDRVATDPGTPLLYDSTVLTANAADALRSLPVPGRHGTRIRGGRVRGNVVGRVDGGAIVKADRAPGG